MIQPVLLIVFYFISPVVQEDTVPYFQSNWPKKVTQICWAGQGETEKSQVKSVKSRGAGYANYAQSRFFVPENPENRLSRLSQKKALSSADFYHTSRLPLSSFMSCSTNWGKLKINSEQVIECAKITMCPR